MLRVLSRDQLDDLKHQQSLDEETLRQAADIVEEVKRVGDPALLKFAEKFESVEADTVRLIDRTELENAWSQTSSRFQQILSNTCQRIRSFAAAQLDSLSSLELNVPSGRCGHSIEPIERAGCYAPGGRYPLPSSVLMTAAVAREAGCKTVIVASPNPSALTLAAAHCAQADYVLPFGGAHAISALAHGTAIVPRVDVIAGPGNRWVTAAKKHVFGQVAVDMLAGPSELLIIADDTASPSQLAADLLAQAEHDTDARTILVTTDASQVDSIQACLASQLENLPTAVTARDALQNGAIVVVERLEEAAEVANHLAPEHLQIHCRNPQALTTKIQHAGCVFIGHQTAEVFGDYGLGPNHTLPTGGTARYRGGLCVFDFVRIRTWIQLDQALPITIQQEMADLAEREA